MSSVQEPVYLRKKGDISHLISTSTSFNHEHTGELEKQHNQSKRPADSISDRDKDPERQLDCKKQKQILNHGKHVPIVSSPPHRITADPSHSTQSASSNFPSRQQLTESSVEMTIRKVSKDASDSNTEKVIDKTCSAHEGGETIDKTDAWLSNFDPLPLTPHDADSASLAPVEDEEKTHFILAWSLIKSLDEIISKLSSDGPDGFLKHICIPGLWDMAERLLVVRSQFEKAGKPFNIDIGYHYTKPENLEEVQLHGLLTKSEREKREILSTFNGSAYGDGIYTGNNPGEFYNQKYGSLGLVVLRIKGKVGLNAPEADEDCDTIVDKLEPYNRMVVLKQSAQCLPIAQFNSEQIRLHDPNCSAMKILMDFHQAIQDRVDSLLNVVDTEMQKPTHSLNPVLGVPSAYLGEIFYRAPAHISDQPNESRVDTSKAFEILDAFPGGPRCVVCNDQLGTDEKWTVRLTECRHLIHWTCHTKSMRCNTRCLSCRHSSTPLGHMPTGTMKVARDWLLTCPGYEPWGTFCIEYTIQRGIQRDFHPNPGRIYEEAKYHAYLPDTREGRALLSRLQDAFRHGLTFRIATSQTTQKTGVIKWADIPHKSRVRGGPFGYPDEHYFKECHAALDRLRVRPAGSDELRLTDSAGKQHQ